MRLAALTLIGSVALAGVSAAATTTRAIPNLPAETSANLIQVSGGCGPAFHRDAWGYCLPNPYEYGGYGYYGPYFGGGYYRPHWGHHWRLY